MEWSRLSFAWSGAGADPICSEPESAPGPQTSGAGAAQKLAAPQHWSESRPTAPYSCHEALC